ncbi:molecular chaperone DnaJ [Levyella massiliensis]|uniref:molecular chaperone DnaJ n=1 Tax=Levyella massiliensis TaxID=938289 RepID=UPI0003715BA4|nr:molecular chaperone DnaJ [Levyella massiliensis]
MQDPYEVLGVSRNATLSDIKKSYRQKAKQYHPDLNPGDAEAAKKFNDLSEAYGILQDDEKRRLYDTYGAAAFENGAGGAGGGFGFDMDDIFGDLFGDLFGRAGARQNPNRARRGADIRKEVRLTFKEAYFGVEKTVNIRREHECAHCHGTGAKDGTAKRTCPTCHGAGVINREVHSPFGRIVQQTTCPNCGGRGEVIDEKCPHCHGNGRETESVKLSVKIPAGIADGNILPMRGQGHSGANGGPSGDVYIVVRVEASELYERHGNDLYFEMPLSFVQATLGDEVEVPTMEGKEAFRIPAGTQTGTRFTLKGKGVRDVRTGRPGDLHFIIDIQTPTHLNEEQADALRAYAKTMGDEVEEKEKNFWEKVKDLFD